MKNDKLLISALFGFISTIPSEILSHLIVYLGIGKYSTYQLASLLITFNRPNFIIGFIVDFLVGGFLGVLFYLVFDKLGSDYLIIKVTFTSLLAWFTCELVFTSTIEGRFFDIRPIGDYYNNILGALIFGITLGLLTKRFIFNKSIS